MACGEIHQNDTTQLIVTISDCDGAINISQATAKQLILQRPSDYSKFTVNMSFYTDGSDGKLNYIFGSGDLDTVGVWKFQTYIQVGPSGWRSDIGNIKVERNL